MKTRHIVGISALSTLLTIVVVLAMLLSSTVAIAQNPDPVAPEDAASGYPDGVLPDSSAPAADTTPEDLGPAATTDYLHIAGTAFIANLESDTRVYTSNGCVYLNGTNLHANYSLSLPYGSTITSIRLYFRDSSVASTGTLWLARYDDGLSLLELGEVNTAGSAGTSIYSTVSVNVPIDYANYSYVMQWYQPVQGTTLQLCGFRIGYTKPGIFGVALPAVVKN